MVLARVQGTWSLLLHGGKIVKPHDLSKGQHNLEKCAYPLIYQF